MTLKNRVFLIVLGALIFLIAGPILVLAARGYYFDFETHRLVKTGTIVVKTDPRGAAVFVNGENSGDTPFVKRFVEAGEYAVQIIKPGYLPWSKKVNVYEERLTPLPTAGDKIFLLRQHPEELFRAATSTAVLRGPASNRSSARYFLATSTGQLLLKGTTNAADQVIAASLPKFKTSKILVSPNRQIFLLLDDTLYQVNDTLLKVGGRVAYAKWAENDDAVVYGNDHEIWLYRPDSGTPNQLITRLADSISEAEFNAAISYFFWSSQGKIYALEYDPLLTPNLYILAETKSAQVPLSVNPAGTELQYLDAGELVTLKIR